MDTLISLFAENAWPLVWLIALVDLILAIVMYATGRGRLLVAIIALAVLAVMLLGLELFIVTDRERVEAVVDAMAAAVQTEDLDSLASHLAPQCRYGGMGHSAITQMAAGVFRSYDIATLKLNGRKTEVFRLRNEARTEFVAVARARQGTTDVSPYPSRWVLTFKKSDGGDWQVVEIQQLPVVGDNRDPILPPNQIGM